MNLFTIYLPLFRLFSLSNQRAAISSVRKWLCRLYYGNWCSFQKQGRTQKSSLWLWPLLEGRRFGGQYSQRKAHLSKSIRRFQEKTCPCRRGESTIFFPNQSSCSVDNYDNLASSFWLCFWCACWFDRSFIVNVLQTYHFQYWIDWPFSCWVGRSIKLTCRIDWFDRIRLCLF